jgi:hypothetical protein
MILGLIYNGVIVGEVEIAFDGHISQIVKAIDEFGIDISHYSLSDMKQDGIGKRLDFFLKEEDYIKLRDNKIIKY